MLALAEPLTSCASQHSGAGLPLAGSWQSRLGCPPMSDPCAWLLEPPLPRAPLGSCLSFAMQGWSPSFGSMAAQAAGAGAFLGRCSFAALRALCSPKLSAGDGELCSCLMSHPPHSSWPRVCRVGLGSCLAALGIPVKRKSCLLSDPCGGGFATWDWCFNSFSGIAEPKRCGAVGSI